MFESIGILTMSSLHSETEITPEDWSVVDRAIVMIGLMLFEASLLKSGYPREVQEQLMLRVQHLLQGMGIDYGSDKTT